MMIMCVCLSMGSPDDDDELGARITCSDNRVLDDIVNVVSVERRTICIFPCRCGSIC